MADRAFRIPAGHGVARRRLLHVLEFGLGEVDGHRQAMRIEPRISVELGALDVVVGHAVVVEPLHRGHAAVPMLDKPEPVVEIGGTGAEQPHDDVGVHRALLRFEQAAIHRRGAKSGEQGVGNDAGATDRPLGPLCATVLLTAARTTRGRFGTGIGIQVEQGENPIPRPVRVARIEVKVGERIVNQRVDACVHRGQPIVHRTPSATRART